MHHSALVAEDKLKVQHTDMTKKLTNRAYVRSSQKVEQLAEVARVRQNKKEQMEVDVSDAEKELQAIQATPTLELLDKEARIIR